MKGAQHNYLGNCIYCGHSKSEGCDRGCPYEKYFKGRGMSREHWQLLFSWFYVAFWAYIVVAMWAYRFSHPEQTETQLFLHFWDAMTWQ